MSAATSFHVCSIILVWDGCTVCRGDGAAQDGLVIVGKTQEALNLATLWWRPVRVDDIGGVVAGAV